MKLLKATVHNFGSYKELDFNFNDQGLTLIHGQTGSGKSTLTDVASWILYGVTSKNGNVDDIRAWDTTDATKGVLDVQIGSETLCITRIRGKGVNDLRWTENLVLHRGKDITETQKLLNKRLGVDESQYLITACYNEFSPTHNFFVATSKQRRELLDNITNLSLPNLLTEGVLNARKETREAHLKILKELDQAVGGLEQLRKAEIDSKRSAKEWCEKQDKVIESISRKARDFQTIKEDKVRELSQQANDFDIKKTDERAQLQVLVDTLSKELEHTTNVCEHCEQPLESVTRKQLELENAKFNLARAAAYTNHHFDRLLEVEKSVNIYEEQLAAETKRLNPYEKQLVNILATKAQLEGSIANLIAIADKQTYKIDTLNQIGKLALTLRVNLSRNVTRTVQDTMNYLLEKHFDSEIKAELIMDNSDNLEVSLMKNGHECNYKQLSKGQRTLLKLCFAIAIMKSSSNNIGVHFDTLIFDEALAGLDSDLKAKAFSLFTELSISHSSVFIIEHDVMLQNMFDNQFHVILVNDNSEIKHQ